MMNYVRKMLTAKCQTVIDDVLTNIKKCNYQKKSIKKRVPATEKKARYPPSFRVLHASMQLLMVPPCFLFSCVPLFYGFFYFNAFIMFVKTSAPPKKVPTELPSDERMNTNKTFNILFL